MNIYKTIASFVLFCSFLTMYGMVPQSWESCNQEYLQSIDQILTKISKEPASIDLIDPSYIEPLLKAAFENPATPIKTIDTILKFANKNNIVIPAKYNMSALKLRVKSFFAKKHPNITASVLVMLVFYKHMYGNLPYQIPALTQTQKNLIANSNVFINSDNLSTYTSQRQLATMIDQIITKEKELELQGFVSFIHAQQWHYKIIEQWYTKLWQIYTKKSVGQFLFLHCIQPCDEAQLKQEHELRKHILAYGREESTRKNLLFLNYAFFGNENNQGSCSAHYFLNNMNINPINIYLKNVFGMFGYETCYQKYQHELEELESEHDSLCLSYGQVLLIGIPKVILPECVYCAHPGGYKRTVEISGLGYTDDINIIMDTLRKAPETISESNCLEFCLILTGDMLTPDSGIKVFSYNAADPASLAAFDKKSDELFERIKKDIQQYKKIYAAHAFA